MHTVPHGFLLSLHRWWELKMFMYNLNLFSFPKEKNSSMKNGLDQAHKEREELAEKILLLTLASEEKQVNLPIKCNT